VDLPGGIESIGTGAFSYSDAITVTLASGNPYYTVDSGVLYNMNLSTLLYYPARNHRTESVTLETTTIIDDRACHGQRSLARIELQKVVEIRYMPFCSCIALIDVLLPPTLVQLGENVFGCLNSLYTIDLPSSLTHIGDGCFEECRVMPILELPDSVVRCGDRFVYYCTNLMEVWLGNSVIRRGPSVCI
jgi:hypothetical protein